MDNASNGAAMNQPFDWTPYITTFGIIVAAFLGLLSGVWARGKNKADAAASLVTAATDLVDKYKVSLDDCVAQAKTSSEDAKKARDDANKAMLDMASALLEATNLKEQVRLLTDRVNILEQEKAALRESVTLLEQQIQDLGHTPKTKKG